MSNDDAKPLRSSSIDTLKGLDESLIRLTLVGSEETVALDTSDIPTQSPLETLATSSLELIRAISDVKLDSTHIERLIYKPNVKRRFWTVHRKNPIERPGFGQEEEATVYSRELSEAISQILDQSSQAINQLVAFDAESQVSTRRDTLLPTHWLLFSGEK